MFSVKRISQDSWQRFCFSVFYILLICVYIKYQYFPSVGHPNFGSPFRPVGFLGYTFLAGIIYCLLFDTLVLGYTRTTHTRWLFFTCTTSKKNYRRAPLCRARPFRLCLLDSSFSASRLVGRGRSVTRARVDSARLVSARLDSPAAHVRAERCLASVWSLSAARLASRSRRVWDAGISRLSVVVSGVLPVGSRLAFGTDMN